MKWLPRILGAAMLAGAAGVGIATALEAPAGDPQVVELLSGLNYVPSQSNIDVVLGEGAVEDLIEIAEDSSIDSDPGLRIRAFRSLGQYDGNPQRATAASALRRAIADYGAESSGTKLLYLRASMLSLAAIDGGNAVSNLVTMLGHPSRDIRAACAQALGITGVAAAIQPLRARDLIEPEEQVRLAIADALFLLGSKG
ncbi:MAG: HEAT repeat domain-containing protein [Myxococcales bacterium]|nr:HEAT repeat domain-containing protein [Myxococcales bacterium]